VPGAAAVAAHAGTLTDKWAVSVSNGRRRAFDCWGGMHIRQQELMHNDEIGFAGDTPRHTVIIERTCCERFPD
jgi:hypothetical protein